MTTEGPNSHIFRQPALCARTSPARPAFDSSCLKIGMRLSESLSLQHPLMWPSGRSWVHMNIWALSFFISFGMPRFLGSLGSILAVSSNLCQCGIGMKTLRQLHLYLGCIFAPLIIYFSLSGAWQVFRLNDVPKNEPPSWIHSALHELSKPHTNSVLPGLNPKAGHSVAFSMIVLLMGLGMVVTSSIGVFLALRQSRSPRIAALCIGVGVILPICLLFVR